LINTYEQKKHLQKEKKPTKMKSTPPPREKGLSEEERWLKIFEQREKGGQNDER